MRTILLLPVLLLSALAAPLLSGCGDDDDTAADGDADADADADPVAHDEGCSACDDPPACSETEVLTCCACVRRQEPDRMLARTACTPPGGVGDPGAVDEDCGSGAPDFGCFLPEGARTRGEPRDVVVYGVTDIFGNGVDADDITLEVFSIQPGCVGQPGELLATATASVADCPAALGADCCHEEDPDNPGEFRDLGYFEFTTPVPSETPLALRTSGNPALWKPLVLYDLYFANEEVEADGRAFYEARVLSSDDYRTIPAAAGMPAGISPGNGALAGEIHDCGDVRLSFAEVGTEPAPPAPFSITYFNDNPDDPLPISSRVEGTSILGLWASLNLPPGPARVSAIGAVDGALVSLGWVEVCVFPDTVSAVTLQGPPRLDPP